MYDPNVFMILTPCDPQFSRSAFRLPENKRWFQEGAGGVAEQPLITSREQTPAPDFDLDDSDFSFTDRLIIRFDELLGEHVTCLNGVQMGTNSLVCAVLLGHRGTPGVSAKQCFITVDDNLQIWIHDYHSTHGTAVSCNGQNMNQVRKKYSWLVAHEPAARALFQRITVHSGQLVIRLTFPSHVADSQYIKNLRTFIQKCKETVPPMTALGLYSAPITAAASQAPTPGNRPVYIQTETIGGGTFGVVFKFMRQHDWKPFAAKIFSISPMQRKRKHGGDDEAKQALAKIRQEYQIMKDHRHPHVIEVHDFQESPRPLIIMDYYGDGNILNADVTDHQYTTATGQVLDVLGYLHAQQVVHRDLKPENILVKFEPFFQIVVTDFGCSKILVDDSTVMKTFCGTLLYLAPEVFFTTPPSYKPSVDVWAAGVMFLEWLRGFPPGSGSETKDEKARLSRWIAGWTLWKESLDERLLDQKIDLSKKWIKPLLGFLRHMIVFNPSERWSMDECLEQGIQDGLFKRRVADDLIVSAHDSDETSSQGDEDSVALSTRRMSSPSVEGSVTPTKASFIQHQLWPSVSVAVDVPGEEAANTSANRPPTIRVWNKSYGSRLPKLAKLINTHQYRRSSLLGVSLSTS